MDKATVLSSLYFKSTSRGTAATGNLKPNAASSPANVDWKEKSIEKAKEIRRRFVSNVRVSTTSATFIWFIETRQPWVGVLRTKPTDRFKNKKLFQVDEVDTPDFVTSVHRCLRYSAFEAQSVFTAYVNTITRLFAAMARPSSTNNAWRIALCFPGIRPTIFQLIV